MATSACVKCGYTTFEHKSAEPRGSKFKLAFIQCAQCGGVVGVMEQHNLGARIAILEERLARIESLVAQAARRSS